MIDLNSLYDEVLASKNTCLVETRIAEPLSKICRCNSCKAPIRFLMAGLVAKTRIDIQNCVDKIAKSSKHIDNYIVITTDAIDPEVNEYASSLYKEMGTEIVILDCIGFIRHFLHFFHRRRLQFLDNYQQLVLSEPASSVPQPLKEAFLTLRIAAEYDSSDE